MGRSYGDSSVNQDGVLVQTPRNRLLALDEQTGCLTCEAGVSLEEVIQCVLPKGWFLPTTPGTKFVTIGGAIAADVHGKITIATERGTAYETPKPDSRRW